MKEFLASETPEIQAIIASIETGELKLPSKDKPKKPRPRRFGESLIYTYYSGGGDDEGGGGQAQKPPLRPKLMLKRK